MPPTLVAVPVDVRGSAQRALAWHDQGHAGATRVDLRRAKQLTSSTEVTAKTLADMRAWFARHGPDARNGGTCYRKGRRTGGGFWKFAITGEVGKGAVAWECWGGDAAYLWLKSPAVRALLRRAYPTRKRAVAEIRLAQFTHATCAMFATSATVGTVEARAVGATRCELQCSLRGLTPGQHGLHVHECAPRAAGDCGSACAHYNPDGGTHGGPADPPGRRHRGDFGNVVARAPDGECVARVVADLTLRELIGRSIVVHEGADDLGRGVGRTREESLRTGNAGARVACGIVLASAHPRQRGSD